MSERFSPRYSGASSKAFWRAIGRISDEKRHDIAYSAGVLLQNMEEHCLKIIKGSAEGSKILTKMKPAGRRGSSAPAERVARNNQPAPNPPLQNRG